jgi:uncharacterized protein (TIGR02145 family)
MNKLYIVVVGLLVTAITFAQAPGAMSYQAIVRDSGGALVASKAVGIQISILSGSSSGAAVYTETQTPMTNVNGLVSLEIGTGVTSGDFTTIDWSSSSYFIKTETDPAGGSNYSITGTSQLMSVPYALHAKKADNGITVDQAADITKNKAKVGQPSGRSVGDMQYWNGTEWVVIAATANEAATLQMISGVPSWVGGTISKQTWMTGNLDVTIYRDGTPIPLVADATLWGALKTGAWCYYTGTDGMTYGRMYNWYAVAGIYDTASLNDPSLRKELAPLGWHVPSDYEWTTFMSSLGGENVAGGKMKETGSTHWKSPNTDATNSSDFTALPGGLRTHTGAFRYIGEIGQWWSSSEPSLDYADCRFLHYGDGKAYAKPINKTYGFSVRCLKD